MDIQEYSDCRNPILPPQFHIPDPEAHAMPDGRLYVYGSWDRFDDETYCSREYRVFSTADMAKWTDHGISFQSSQVPWLLEDNKTSYRKVDFDWSNPTPLQKKIIEKYLDKSSSATPADNDKATNLSNDLLYAPDAIHKNGKYFLFFCAQDDSEGVAVADTPFGPFLHPKRLKCGGIDPAVFIDDDGQAYFFWGQFRASGAKLTESMDELVETSIVNRIITEEDHWFHEGSSVRKRNGIYYYVYCCIKRGKATSLGYATSPNPLGPYVHKGIIIDNDGCDPQTWNNHGSIEQFNGQWYVFYHRSSRNGKNRRRLCVEPIFFDDDGTIPEVPMTSQGAGKPFGIGENIEAYRACRLEGNCFIGLYPGDREGIVDIQDGDSAIFRYAEWNKAISDISCISVGSGNINVYADSDSEPFSAIEIREGRISYKILTGVSGKHEIKLEFRKPANLALYSFCFS